MARFPYDKEVEKLMKRTYNQFSEKEKRNYAAIEAIKLGHGGIKYISELFGLSSKTVSNGINELKKIISAEKVVSEEKEEVGKP